MDGVKPDDGDEGFAEDNTPDDELVPMDVNLTAGAEGEGSDLLRNQSCNGSHRPCPKLFLQHIEHNLLECSIFISTLGSTYLRLKPTRMTKSPRVPL